MTTITFCHCPKCGEHIAYLPDWRDGNLVPVDIWPIDPDEPTCMVCGCTEGGACPGGCYWVDDGDDPDLELCSRCLTFDPDRNKPHKCPIVAPPNLPSLPHPS